MSKPGSATSGASRLFSRYETRPRLHVLNRAPLERPAEVPPAAALSDDLTVPIEVLRRDIPATDELAKKRQPLGAAGERHRGARNLDHAGERVLMVFVCQTLGDRRSSVESASYAAPR